MSKRRRGQGLNFLIGGFKKLFLDEKAPASVRYKAGMMYGFLDAGGKWPENYFPGNDRSFPDPSPDWTDIDRRAEQLAKKDAAEELADKAAAVLSGGGANGNTSSSENK